jgi:hypothetical protein
VKLRASAVKVIDSVNDRDNFIDRDPSKLAQSTLVENSIIQNDESESLRAYDLKAIKAPERHSQTLKWIVFSDLHVKGSSIDCCEEVLREVHSAAVQRNAGIIFLGDFWHVRGALNVDLLNRVLKSLRQWKQPVIMIPGNHDQVR